jgi:hypothetical protein
VVTAEELAARRRAIAGSADLQALLAHLRDRARPLVEPSALPAIPEHKALLSTDGGVCPDDGAALAFDPWNPTAHRCPRCGKAWTGERHDRYWARYQHLWLAERAAHLATLAVLSDDAAAGARAGQILTAYAERYWRYPNRDNVLGPSRLFFSTYIEALWITNYLAAAMLLKAADRLDDATARAVSQVADEAATLIGDYDERFSNRQTWNNAALTAIAVWFEDEELAQRAIEGPTGLLAHLLRGFGGDGMWYEGENYHLFALRGLLTGAGWARLAGVDCCGDPRLAERVAAALRAPALSALPDFTFPARKDSRFGVSLAQPMYLELWEIGLARLGKGDEGRGTGELANWLAALYRSAAPQPELFESYLHDAPFNPVPRLPSRATLSWWSLLEMAPELPGDPSAWRPRSVLLETQGLAVLRGADRYAGLECGLYGGGHGHPDRLHLTLHADGVHWLPDPGTGSYVSRDLFWYRSTLAHNAPRLDGASQPPGDAVCEMFDVQDDWAWVRGRYGGLTRTVVSGPAYVVDVVELAGREERVVELPWHFGGSGEVVTGGRWETADLADEFVTRVERFVPDRPGPLVLEHTAHRAQLTAHCLFDGELLRAAGPGLPGSDKRDTFYVARARGRNLRFVTVLEPHTGEPRVRAVRASGETVEVETAGGAERHRFTGASWEIEGPGEGAPRSLRGEREIAPPFEPLLELEGPTRAVAAALRAGTAPLLDGTLAGFDLSEPLHLALEDQYRRSEDPYPGPDEFSAVAYAAWDETALYLAVEVTKPDLCLRAGPPDAPPLKFDNEPDDIHSDGLQVYVAGEQGAGSAYVGYLIVPDKAGRGVRAAATTDSAGDPHLVQGSWQRTERGYRVTVQVPWPAEARPHVGGRVGFDLIINEMLPGRVRRAGQLVWSGGNGWVWLRGDRQDPARFGVLELVA